MSAFIFDFDLGDDLDESFDPISLPDSTPGPCIDKALGSQAIPGEDIPADEIPLTALVCTR